MGNIDYIDNFEEWRHRFKFFTTIKVRFSETDMFGHMNNVSPFIYFEEARIEFLKSVGLFNDLHDTTSGIPVVADLKCDYHKQLYFNDEIKLYVKVNEIGTSSLDVHYMAVNQGEEVCLTGRGRLVQINPTTGKAMPLDVMTGEKLLEA